MEEKIILNGRLVEEKDAVIPVKDYGVLYGFQLFETMRAYSGKIPDFERHMTRLRQSAKKIGMDIPPTNHEIESQISKLLKSNSLSNAYVRFAITFGDGGERFAFKKCTPNTFIFCKSLPENLDEIQEKGVSASVTKDFARNPKSITSKIKSGNYLENILAKKQAKDAGFFDTILLDADGNIAEFSTANIFIVQDGILKTPTLQAILPGITRETVLDIAAKTGLKYSEADISLNDLNKSTEVFLTNTTLEIVPVVKIDDKKVGLGVPGDITKRLQAEYKKKFRLGDGVF
ncbi:MAG TPA: branched-chain amino acid aminotransferase [Candidatus Altiarchaeales archaeon]|nr:branched-chain amino acid aminotransferase [Candidatus Altiarchaeales archaeon]